MAPAPARSEADPCDATRDARRVRILTRDREADGSSCYSRFYAASNRMLDMTASRWRAGSTNEILRFAIGECSLGAILVASSEKGVVAITLGDDPETLVRDLQDRFRRAEIIGGDESCEALVTQVVGLIEAPGIGLDLPLDIRGTAFQQKVWRALADIPVGQTASYTEIAERIGAPDAVRAVAGACAANALGVAIPCHRVVRRDGALSGYRWGIARKRALLTREGAAAAAEGMQNEPNGAVDRDACGETLAGADRAIRRMR